MIRKLLDLLRILVYGIKPGISPIELGEKSVQQTSVGERATRLMTPAKGRVQNLGGHGPPYRYKKAGQLE